MKSMMTRRRFLHGVGAGTALVTMPQFLAACGGKGGAAATTPAAAPANPFLDWFGIDEAMLRRVMAELTSRGGDSSIKKVSVSWVDSDERVLVVNRHGRIVTDQRPMARLYVNVTAERGGVTQSNGADLAGRRGFDWLTDAQLREVADRAVARTLVLFDARRPPAGELPVILAAGASGILLHEAIGHGLEADFNRKGTSIYASMLGQQIAPEFVTIVDDATVAHERGALNVDDEGNDTERTVLVDRGVLRSYLHDQITTRSRPRARAVARASGSRRCRGCAARTWRTARTPVTS
jgi:TldD protein